ncbi:MAG TPA: hypothetical protein VK600_00255 [Candidatus Saccharimonadales bacterium]|nr:hypothetical protein [Candidatus Saccharimonadales bacterium]
MRWLVVQFAVLILTACSSLPAAYSGTLWDDQGVRFTAPAGWAVRAGGEALSGATPLALISNQPMQDCAGAGGGASCPPPIAKLEPGGVLITWYEMHCVAAGCNLPAGDQILVGGRIAVRYAGPGLCAPLLASDEQVVAITVTPQRVDLIVTCSRGANDAARAAVAAMFDSIQWRTP